MTFARIGRVPKFRRGCLTGSPNPVGEHLLWEVFVERLGSERVRVNIVASTLEGGAGRATSRIIDALDRFGNRTHIETRVTTSSVLVAKEGYASQSFKGKSFLAGAVNAVLGGSKVGRNHRSSNLVGRFASRELVRDTDDIINFHWLGNNFFSVPQISRSKKTVVWTVHDEWLFRGVQHYEDLFFLESQGPLGKFDFPEHLHRLVKKILWTRKEFTVICPSNWIRDRALKSGMNFVGNLEVIPYPIDRNVWFPEPQMTSKKYFGIDPSKKVVLSGAISFDEDPRKGHDLLEKACEALSSSSCGALERNSIVVALYGTTFAPKSLGGIACVNLGVLDDVALRKANSMADLVVIPSRQDNLPQTAMEAQACGAPVLAFEIGGLSDIVEHGRTGLLVAPFDYVLMARAMEKLLCNELEINRSEIWRIAHKKWDAQRIARRYEEVLIEAYRTNGRPTSS